MLVPGTVRLSIDVQPPDFGNSLPLPVHAGLDGGLRGSRPGLLGAHADPECCFRFPPSVADAAPTPEQPQHLRSFDVSRVWGLGVARSARRVRQASVFVYPNV